MRLMFVEWADSLPELVNVVKKLKADGHEILYWVRNDLHFKVNQDDFPGTIFHNHVHAREGKVPANCKLEDYEPLGPDIITHFFRAESVFLLMAERYFPKMLIQERKQLFYDILKYWYGMVGKMSPDAVIFEEIPHHLHSYVAYAVLEFFKIKTIIINSTNIKDRIILSIDDKFNYPGLTSALTKFTGQKLDWNNLPEEVKINLIKHTCLRDTPINSLNSYTERKYRNLFKASALVVKFILIFRLLFNRRVFKLIYKYLDNRINGNAQREYKKVQKEPDFNCKYVYAPLHFQPEASTTVLGGIFANQIIYLEMLAAALPPGWKIYVKEHPVQFYNNGIGYTAFRYRGYYERIAAMKNIEIVPITTSTYNLINNSQITATITGTAAWESLMRFKPAIIFGYNWFQECPGLFRVNNVDGCRRAFKEIGAPDYKIDKDGIINFLFAFSEITINGNFYFFAKKESNVNEVANINNMYNYIIKALG